MRHYIYPIEINYRITKEYVSDYFKYSGYKSVTATCLFKKLYSITEKQAMRAFNLLSTVTRTKFVYRTEEERLDIEKKFISFVEYLNHCGYRDRDGKINCRVYSLINNNKFSEDNPYYGKDYDNTINYYREETYFKRLVSEAIIKKLTMDSGIYPKDINIKPKKKCRV